MVTIAPRYPARLLDEIERLSRLRLPIAEINRRVGRAAWRMSLPRPSYERVRVLVHAARRLCRASSSGYAFVGFEAGLGFRLPRVLVGRFGEGGRLRLRDRASPSS